MPSALLVQRPQRRVPTSVRRAAALACVAMAGLGTGACAKLEEFDDFGFVGSGGGHERFEDGGEGHGEGGGGQEHPDGNEGHEHEGGKDGEGEMPDSAEMPDAVEEPDASDAGQDVNAGGPGDAQSSDGAHGDGAPDAGADAEGDSGHPDLGAVGVAATITLQKVGTPIECPGIAVFSVNPSELSRGQYAQLTVTTIGPLASVHWSVSPAIGGSFSDPASFTPTFVCAAAGQMNITVQANPEAGGSCVGTRFTSYTTPIHCE